MARVCLTYRQKARAEVEKIKVICIGKKKLLGLSWESIAKEMNVPRTTLAHKFHQGTLSLIDWLELWNIIGITAEDFKGVNL